MTASWVALLGALLNSNCAAMPVGLGPTIKVVETADASVNLNPSSEHPANGARIVNFDDKIAIKKGAACHASCPRSAGITDCTQCSANNSAR